MNTAPAPLHTSWKARNRASTWSGVYASGLMSLAGATCVHISHQKISKYFGNLRESYQMPHAALGRGTPVRMLEGQ